jgi:hypothetical protein
LIPTMYKRAKKYMAQDSESLSSSERREASSSSEHRSPERVASDDAVLRSDEELDDNEEEEIPYELYNELKNSKLSVGTTLLTFPFVSINRIALIINNIAKILHDLCLHPSSKAIRFFSYFEGK